MPGYGNQRGPCHPAYPRLHGLHIDCLQSHDLLGPFCSASAIDYLEDCHQLLGFCPGLPVALSCRSYSLLSRSVQVTLQSTGFWDQMWTELQKSFPSAPTDEGSKPRGVNIHTYVNSHVVVARPNPAELRLLASKLWLARLSCPDVLGHLHVAGSPVLQHALLPAADA